MGKKDIFSTLDVLLKGIESEISEGKECYHIRFLRGLHFAYSHSENIDKLEQYRLRYNQLMNSLENPAVDKSDKPFVMCGFLINVPDDTDNNHCFDDSAYKCRLKRQECIGRWCDEISLQTSHYSPEDTFSYDDKTARRKCPAYFSGK